MDTKRYLIYFSYLGTSFNGMQRQVKREVCETDVGTVQGLLEIALSRLKPMNTPVLILSSRTDQGVHATKSAACVDLTFEVEMKPSFIHGFMNKFFHQTDLNIRIIDVLRVSRDFNPRRSPLWRKYIYRFAVLKPDSGLPEHLKAAYTLPIPVTEVNRCLFIRETKFDVDKLQEAASFFIGTKDFISFMAKPRDAPEDLVTIRAMHRLFLEPSSPYFPCPYSDCYNYWHLVCEGRSFLYKQIRRTFAVLLAVAQNRLPVHTVKEMIENPSPTNWPCHLFTAPAYGLYLADIFYDPKDLQLSQQEVEEEERIKAEEDKLRAEKNRPLTMEEKKARIKAHIQSLQKKPDKEDPETVCY